VNLTWILPYALLGGVIGLDVVSFPQAMISRPLVAATLGGAFAGRAGAGLLVGVVLELLALETLPVGASRYPEWGTAAVVGGALFASGPVGVRGALAVAVLCAVAMAWLGGWSMYAIRKVNGWWAKRAIPAMDRGSRGAVLGLQMRGLLLDLVRGALLTVGGLALLSPLSQRLLSSWTTTRDVSQIAVIGSAAAVAWSAAWSLSHGASGSRWFFLAGAATGGILLLAT
jgi:mannose/fructose/N-acetylgalactosamine-specific phosphotransferase system component IIC